MTVPQTLQQYLLSELKDHPERRELIMMMADLATIGKLIASRTSRAGLLDMRGLAGGSNVHEEAQAKLDVYANDLCKQYLSNTGLFAAMASEEEDGVVDLGNPEAGYVIAFDPLDGSSNIDVNVAVGTIFSVHKKLDDLPPGDHRQFLQPGRDQVLAGYILYSSSTMLVFSWGEGVHEFTLDPDLGEFILSNPNLTIPADCPYYSVNEAYAPLMSKTDQAWLAALRQRVGKQRWIASFVADFHRNLVKGGVFYFPAIADGQGGYRPKLRLNYEVKPMAFLAVQAGGAATDGRADILDIVPAELHARVAVVIGNKQYVKEKL